MNKDEIIEVLKENRYKITDQRIDIIDSMMSENKYVSAKKIFSQVQEKFPNISFDTIYRNLATLNKIGLVDIRYQDGEATYKFYCTQEHHHHMICEDCGCISIIKKCPMDILDDIDDGFQITSHKFEVYGICKNCQLKKKEQS